MPASHVISNSIAWIVISGKKYFGHNKIEQLTKIIAVLKGYDRDRCLMKSTQHLYDLAYIIIEKVLRPLVVCTKDLAQIVRYRVDQLKQGGQAKIIIFILYLKYPIGLIVPWRWYSDSMFMLRR